MSKQTGQCLCGAIKYTITGECRDIVMCHCQQCLRAHGHHAAYTQVARAAIAIDDDRHKLTWYQSSRNAKRGFCAECGSSLFWSKAELSILAVAAGSLTQPTQLKTGAHIFTENLADYYAIYDNLQRYRAGLASEKI